MLSGPHQKFAEGIVAGLNGTQAYQAAYPKASYDAARSTAPELLAKPGIIAEIDSQRELAKAQATSPALTLAGKLDFLETIVFGDEQTRDKLRAVELHAKLSGELKDNVNITLADVKIVIGQ